jgi:hypothetical protein
MTEHKPNPSIPEEQILDLLLENVKDPEVPVISVRNWACCAMWM